MTTQRTEPAWMEPWMRECREELLALDPRYVVLFDARWRNYDGECTAVDLHRYLKNRDYQWTPAHESTVRRWLNEIRRVEADCRLNQLTREN